MSIIPQEIHASLSQLISVLTSPDNTLRSQAETQLENDWVKNRPDILLMGLAEQIDGSQDIAIRSFAAVLFRRIASRLTQSSSGATVEVFYNLNPEQRFAIQQKILESLGKETVPNLRNKIGDAVGEIATQYSEHGETWTELLEVLFRASQSTDAGLCETAFRVFALAPKIIEKQHDDIIGGVFQKGFTGEPDVRVASMEAFTSFIREIPKKRQKGFFRLIPDMLNVLPFMKDVGDEDNLSSGFTVLIDLVEVTPQIFKQHFNNLVKFTLSVVADKDMSEQVRQNALELMATFCDCAPNMCKKDPDYARQMVTQCLSLMTDVGNEEDDDQTEWRTSEETENESNDTNHVAGEQCMDRLANSLGGESILVPTFEFLPRMINSSSWRDRHAALMAISSIAEGCRDMMEPELESVLSLVVPTLQDPHPRVAYAACHALGQMSTDFIGTMQTKFHATILPNMIPLLKSPEPRVQVHAAAAMVNFCEEADQDTLKPYLAQLLQNLLLLLHSPKRFVQEQALSTISTVVEAAKSDFEGYYREMMPMLMRVLVQEQPKEYRTLRAKAIECATMIALAIGKEKLGQDALSLVEILFQIMDNITDADDPQTSFLLPSWSRMCRVLGLDFAPYLPKIMPRLISIASSEEDFVPIEDEATMSRMADEGFEIFPGKGNTAIGFRTAPSEERASVPEILVVFAESLGGAFEPYVIETLDKVAFPGLSSIHEELQLANAKLVPPLLNSYKHAHGGVESAMFAQRWYATVGQIFEFLHPEVSIDVLAEMYECFYESLEVAGDNSLTQEHMQSFIEATKSTLENYDVRLKERQDALEGKSDGEEEEDAMLEYQDEIEADERLLSDINKAFHTVFKHQGISFLPYWERLMPFYYAFAASQYSTQRQWALCLMDDVIEFCGEQSWNYADRFIQPLKNGLMDEDAANRQAAAYGVGVAAQKGGLPWSSFVAESIPALFHITQRPDARDENNVFATENACASISKILHFNSSKVPNPEIIVENWINTLPITNDEEAGPYAYAFAATLIDQQNLLIVSKAGEVFTAIVQALDASTLQGKTAMKVVESAKSLVMKNFITPQVAQAVIDSNVKPENREDVLKYFQ